jgi:26S proteasome regulatory subunit N6
MEIAAEVERVDPLRAKLDDIDELDNAQAVPALKAIVGDERDDEAVHRIKELAIYKLGRIFQKEKRATDLAALSKEFRPFFATIPKARTAKIVRTIIEMVSQIPDTLALEETLCKECIDWCNEEKRTFLRLRVENRLATLMFNQDKFHPALELVNKLLREVKKMDDKQLLVEIHLTEARIHHALRNYPKAKAALTASRTAANAIYVTPTVQANIDMMSGSLHAEEKDYKTSYSYYFEAFEAFNQLGDNSALEILRYMLLCKIMSGHAGDVQSIANSKSGSKYAGVEIDAILAITKAAKDRSLEEFQDALKKYDAQLVQNRLINTHLQRLYEDLKEANLIKIIEPFSRVEVTHVASLIKLPADEIELKLSQMILDNKFCGILDQGKGHLIVYPEFAKEPEYEAALTTISNMGDVVDSLFRRAEKLA